MWVKQFFTRLSYKLFCYSVLETYQYRCSASTCEWFHIVSRMRIQISRWEQRGGIITLCWVIWSSQNDLVWNKKIVFVNSVVVTTKQYLFCGKQPETGLLMLYFNQWWREIKLSFGWKSHRNVVKIKIDATMFEDHNMFGIWIIAWDCIGEFIQVQTKLFKDRYSPKFVEVMAIKEALSWIIAWDGNKVFLESDF